MAHNKSSIPVSASALGVSSSTVAPQVAGTAGGTAQSSTSAGSTGSGISPAGGLLAGLGVKSSGFNQVKVTSVATSAFEAKVSKRLTGAESDLPAGTSLLVNGQTFTVASIVSVLQAVLDLFSAEATAKAKAKTAVTQAVAALNAELSTAHQFLTGLDAALEALFGKGNPVLENFGLSKGVKKPPTVASKAKAQGTAALTRKARNTLGKVQRLSVTGGTAKVAVLGPNGELLPGSSPGAAAPSAAGSTPTAAPASGSSSTGGSNSASGK